MSRLSLLVTLGAAYVLHFGNGYQNGNQWCPSCFCGISSAGRVVGGKPSSTGDNPWMVALVLRGHVFFCGGTLISNIYVLTAAHCVKWLRPWNVEVVLSDQKLSDMNEKVERRSVVQIKIHHEYNWPTKLSNDIALLRLDFPVAITSSVVPVCLPKPGIYFDGREGYIAGWGRNSESGTYSNELLVAKVPIISWEQCMRLDGYSNITKGMMCAGPISGGVDACKGDSGGPLLVKNKYGRFLIAGIVSWGIGCARPNKPGVYTQVSHYISWIVNNTRNGCYCS